MVGQLNERSLLVNSVHVDDGTAGCVIIASNMEFNVQKSHYSLKLSNCFFQMFRAN